MYFNFSTRLINDNSFAMWIWITLTAVLNYDFKNNAMRIFWKADEESVEN